MNVYGLIASIVQSVAWPAAFVFAILIFRERLAELLPMLRVKHKNWEVSFRLEKAEKEAAELPVPAPAPGTIPTEEEKSRFEQIADISPRAAILEKRREIEEAVSNLALRYGIVSEKTPMLRVVRILRNEGIIDPHVSGFLDDLRVIGNSAAHAGPDTAFTKDDALRFGSLADRVINRLSMLSPDNGR
jgi:Domain of unknown function (DUF4145)